MKCVRCIVHGRVQGVGYRQWTMKQARNLGIAGWVANKNDGTVELIAQGEEGSVNELLALLKQGPTFANVTDVFSSDETPVEHSDFQIVRI